MMEEHGPSKSLKATEVLRDAPLHEWDSGRLDPRRQICFKLQKVEQPAHPDPAPRGFRKWLVNLKRLWLEEKRQPGSLGIAPRVAFYPLINT